MKHEIFFYEFEIKYYQWRLKEAQKEYESGFERLQSYLICKNARCPDPRLLEEVGDLIFHK